MYMFGKLWCFYGVFGCLVLQMISSSVVMDFMCVEKSYAILNIKNKSCVINLYSHF
jgi:hypothetical protein